MTMFAPPPVQLSRSEIEARLAARRKSAASAGSLTRQTSASSDPKFSSLHRNDSQSPTSLRCNRTAQDGDKIKVSSPISSPQTSKVESPVPGAFRFTAEAEKSPLLPGRFGEHPRQAPAPPKKSSRPPDEWFTRSKTGAAPPPQSPVPEVPIHQTPPAIPAKSPKRQKSKAHDRDVVDLLQDDPFVSKGGLSTAISKLQIKDAAAKALTERPGQPVRSLTEPTATVDHPSEFSARKLQPRNARSKAASVSVLDTDRKSMAELKLNARLSGVKGAKIDKTSSKRSSVTSTLRAELLDELFSFETPQAPPRRATDGEIKPARSSTPPELKLPWRRRKKGETMSMLIQSGFFSEAFLVKESNPSQNLSVKIPPPLALLDKDLPATPTSIMATPTSIMATPTELYQTPPRPTRPVVRKRRPGSKKRSPLAQIATTHAKANSTPPVHVSIELSPSRLSAIPENATFSENSHDSSGVETPVATQIHLRGGSVVTVSPPELTAWKRSIYVQGPIKFPKPTIVPRKNSVASLEPFQEAIEQVYQEALNIPRRRSDDAVVDDVCDFFDDFGFDEISFEGDVLAVDEIKLDETNEIETDVPAHLERFSTPPAEPEATPVEKVVAKEIIEVMSKAPPVPKPPIPPVENEETLRARGIARLSHRAAYSASSSHHGRKDSLTLAKAEPSVLSLLPLPDESMLEAVLEPSRPENDVDVEEKPMEQKHIDGDDDVEEMNGSSSWLAPGAYPSSPGLQRSSSSRNPMGRVRRLVASASGML